MNRRSVLKSIGAAVGVLAAGRVATLGRGREHHRRTAAGRAFLHPAIQANIDYWMRAAPKWLAECPPYHVSYYAVKEGEGLRVYAVRWNGANLNDHKVWVPANEDDLIADAQAEIRRFSKAAKENFDIGERFEVSSSDVSSTKAFFCSYVFNSPLHRRNRWAGSMSTWLLKTNRIYGRY